MGSQSWFEQAEARARKAAEHQEGGEDSAADVDVETTPLRSVSSEAHENKPASRSLPPQPKQQDLKARLLKKTGDEPSREKSPSHRSSMSTLALTIGVIIVGVGLIGASAAALLSRGQEPAPVTMPTAKAKPAVKPVGYAGTCTDASGKTPVAAGRNDLRSTVVAFETAYYNRDARGLMETVAKDSGLAATDWDTVLDQAAPEGTTWCVTLQPPRGSSVDIDLVVTSPDGEEQTYRQRVSGRQVPGSTRWQLTKIDSRS